MSGPPEPRASRPLLTASAYFRGMHRRGTGVDAAPSKEARAAGMSTVLGPPAFPSYFAGAAVLSRRSTLVFGSARSFLT
jgi:hypothetical protein